MISLKEQLNVLIEKKTKIDLDVFLARNSDKFPTQSFLVEKAILNFIERESDSNVQKMQKV